MKSNALHDDLVAALRTYGASHVQLTRAFAESLELHATDAGALAEIIYSEDSGAPISPAELARRLSLSRPALSACLNRLEALGHVARTHESVDRRVVTLRCDPKIYSHAANFFQEVSARMANVVAELSPQQIATVCDVLQKASNAVLAESSPVK